MSSVEHLRHFVNERLTAAAEEIFGVFQKAFVEYEEEIYRQRQLLDFLSKPEAKSQRIELTQQYVRVEEVPAEQPLCFQRNGSPEQEFHEPLLVKEEEEEVCTSQGGEPLALKEEANNFTLTPSQCEFSQGQNPNLNIVAAGRQNQRDSEPRQDNPAVSRGRAGKQPFKCDMCGKSFPYNSQLQVHLRFHTGEKPYACDICGKRFCLSSELTSHIRIHTGEKPYMCDTCGRGFRLRSLLTSHARIHTGEKPYSCKTCGKHFRFHSCLLMHNRIHTGEKPHVCPTCGKGFLRVPDLKKHTRVHTGEKLKKGFSGLMTP